MVAAASGELTVSRGVGYGVVAYLIWGFFPVFFKQLSHVPPLHVVSHRIFWSLIFLMVVIAVRGEGGALRRALVHRRTLWFLLASALLIFTNWLVFIMAVGAGQVLQSSLGYFMTPLVNVLLGVVILRERLRFWQLLSLLLALAGVIILVVRLGEFPLVALVLATTFGLYGLLRKMAPVEALSGLAVETGILVLPAMGVLGWSVYQGGGLLGAQPLDWLLLPLAGVVTAIPLLLFAAAARRLRLTTIGFLQYLTPSLHFLQAVVLYREPFGGAHLASFCCIWAGLLLFSVDAVRFQRQGCRPESV
jgi:chloramphenicol-sensitive protein RarD